MEGERRTMSLRGGVGNRGWLHQSGTHQDAAEFVRTVVPERLRGTGLSDSDYAALALYISSGIPRLQSPKVDTKLAEQGKPIFEQRCSGCHAGPSYSSGSVNAGGPGLYKLGSETSNMRLLLPKVFTKLFPPPSDSLYEQLRGDRALGPGDEVEKTVGFRGRPARAKGEFKAPTLVNVWDNTIFFHDGRVDTLEAAVDDISARVAPDLSAQDKRAVVEFLKTL
jgi:cytochrome c peroxidase